MDKGQIELEVVLTALRLAVGLVHGVVWGGQLSEVVPTQLAMEVAVAEEWEESPSLASCT